ncbi:GTP-binding protein ERG [Hibiscus syriacus]|uniref:GTP-binding protein ERG n=1 Tax=Hibiscus syriacus TaxID=106335 RepID=A0A6A2Z8J6_HIBSY|nr:GTP-binding protein ERG [Hibiscus syriacus]
MGAEASPKQARVLCMNKVDLVEKKKDLLKVAEQFKDLPGYERIEGSGVEDLSRYLMEQEIPYGIEHRLLDWKELRDGSMRIEQHFITGKISQRKILVGKNGSKIGRIGIEANEELRSIFKRDVHLILQGLRYNWGP